MQQYPARSWFKAAGHKQLDFGFHFGVGCAAPVSDRYPLAPVIAAWICFAHFRGLVHRKKQSPCTIKGTVKITAKSAVTSRIRSPRCRSSYHRLYLPTTLGSPYYLSFFVQYNLHSSILGDQTMLHLRVYEEANRAIQEHKWIESEKAGRDLGVDAEQDWIGHYWRTFCRSRLVQHLRGEVFFDEFDTECFGIFSGRFEDVPGLLNVVLERIKEGAENLDLLRWACQEHVPHNPLLDVLKAADINGHRLPPPLMSKLCFQNNKEAV
jgi:hypothetical protein